MTTAVPAGTSAANCWWKDSFAIVNSFHAVVHLPFLQAVFRTEDLTVRQSALAAAAGAVVLPVVALEKRWRRRRAAAPMERTPRFSTS